MKWLDQYFHVSDKKIVLLFGLLSVNVFSSILIQLINLLLQDSSDFIMLFVGGYLGYACYFVMLSVYVASLVRDRVLKMNEMVHVAWLSLVFSFVFYVCSSMLSYYGFMMVMGEGSLLLSLAIMLFILFYVPYSLLCMMQFTMMKNPIKIAWQSIRLLMEHYRACLGLVCVLAVLIGGYMGISNALFHVGLNFQPLVYVRDVLICFNPWSKVTLDPFNWFLFAVIYGVFFSWVTFYGLHLVSILTKMNKILVERNV